MWISLDNKSFCASVCHCFGLPQIMQLHISNSCSLAYINFKFILMIFFSAFFTTIRFLVNLQAVSFGGDVHLEKLRQLEKISSLLICRIESHESERIGCEGEGDDRTCCICYACEADTRFVPCSHISCFGCISRHLLNCQRCFFCNATVVEVVQNDMNTA